MKAISPILILLSIITCSCKKYPEGPSFSLLSKTSRLTNKWKIEEGSNVYYGFGPEIERHEFEKDGSFIFEVEKDTATNQFLQGTWEFSNNKEQVITLLPNFSWRQLTFESKYDTLQIERLKNDEFWFTSTLDGTKKLIPY